MRIFSSTHSRSFCLPLVRSCSLYTWQIAALWFSSWLTLSSVFLNLFCKYSYKGKFFFFQFTVHETFTSPNIFTLAYMYKSRVGSGRSLHKYFSRFNQNFHLTTLQIVLVYLQQTLPWNLAQKCNISKRLWLASFFSFGSSLIINMTSNKFELPAKSL